jgi:hypothetical protein
MTSPPTVSLTWSAAPPARPALRERYRRVQGSRTDPVDELRLLVTAATSSGRARTETISRIHHLLLDNLPGAAKTSPHPGCLPSERSPW